MDSHYTLNYIQNLDKVWHYLAIIQLSSLISEYSRHILVTKIPCSLLARGLRTFFSLYLETFLSQVPISLILIHSCIQQRYTKNLLCTKQF